MQDRDLGYRGLTPEQRRHHRNFDVVAQGNPGSKQVEGSLYQATPSLLVDKDGGNFFLGCDLPVKRSFYTALWGGYPEVVHGWRALKVLEDLPAIDNAGLYAVWDITEQNGLRNRHSVDVVSPLVGGERSLNAIHENVMGKGPTPQELEEMILNAQKAGATIDGWELKIEAAAGMVTVTPLIGGIIQAAEARNIASREKMDRQEAELKIPLSREESLGSLFQQLEIGNIIVGVPFGAYELDWGFTPAKRVDRELKHSSFYGDRSIPLSRSTKVITFKRERLSPGVTQVTPSIGEIVPISWIDPKTNTTVILEGARYANGHIYLKTRAVGTTGRVEEIVYTVSEFRHKFGLTI